jgi:hypothetical protein
MPRPGPAGRHFPPLFFFDTTGAAPIIGYLTQRSDEWPAQGLVCADAETVHFVRPGDMGVKLCPSGVVGGVSA